MSALEFEQKFVLDPEKADEIMEHLVTRCIAGDKHQVIHIRQYYDKEGGRYRASLQSPQPARYIKENKKSIKIGTPYSVNSEVEKEVSMIEFNLGWEKNSNRRLQKTRFEVPGRHPDHKVIVDFFYTFGNVAQSHGTLRGGDVYAIIAEDETMLTPETESLYLRFSLPIYLEEYCLLVVDDTNTEHKIFKSTNMVDTPETVQAVRKAIRRLHEPV